MSLFTDISLAKYAFGLTSAYSSGDGPSPYPYPDQWKIPANWYTQGGSNPYGNPAPTLPAVDSIHGRRCLAVGDNVVSLGSGSHSLETWSANDPYMVDTSTGQSLCGFYLLKFPDAIIVPGPGFVLRADNGSRFALQARMRTEGGYQYWYAYKLNMAGALIDTWDDTAHASPGYHVTTTVSSIATYAASAFNMLITQMFDYNTCRSFTVLCYDHTDLLSSHLPGEYCFPQPTTGEFYVQYLAPTKTTVHAYPTWLNEYSLTPDMGKACFPGMPEIYPAERISGLPDQVVHQSLVSHRNICGEASGYVLAADNSALLRMVSLRRNVCIDGLTFDSCGAYIVAAPDQTRAVGISNCVFSNSEIAIRTSFETNYDTISSSPNGQEQYILQNLFLNCARAISDDMVQSYVATDAIKSGEAQNPKPWVNRRVIGMNTFDGGDIHIELERNPIFETRADIFCNVFLNAKQQVANIRLPEFQSYGNISDTDCLKSWLGYDNRCGVNIEYNEDEGSGYRPSMASWHDYEMIALYIPPDCCMSADITGVRHPFMGQRVAGGQRAALAQVWAKVSPANATVAFNQGYSWSGNSAEDDKNRLKVLWSPYSNCAKGCFNPVLPVMDSRLYYSVGRATDNFVKTGSKYRGSQSWESAMGAMGFMHVTSGVLRVQNMATTHDVGCGDVITGVQCRTTMYTPSFESDTLPVDLMCVGVVCPGVYLVRNLDGSPATSGFGDTTMVPVLIQSARRKYNSLQDAVDAMYLTHPSLDALNKVVSLVCYDDVVVDTNHTEDLSGADGCVSIPANWPSSPTGRLVIVASNNRSLSSRKQSFQGNPGRGFGLRYDAAGSAMISVGANTDYVQIRGIRLIGEAIREAVVPRSYIGIGLGVGVSKFMADSNEFLNCTTGITQ